MTSAADFSRVVSFTNSEAQAAAIKIKQILLEFEELTGAVIQRDGITITRIYREHRPSEVGMVEIKWGP